MVFLALTAVAIGLAIPTFAVYQRDLAAIDARLTAGSRVAETDAGPIEYAIYGDGAPVLVLHGVGGGYDMGLSQARYFIGEGFQSIVPSRFGYLRTPLPADGSAEAQADAYAALLDALNIEQVAVFGHSAGGPATMQFALRHPERTSAMVLLSAAAWAPPSEEATATMPVPVWVYDAIFRSDFIYWTLQRIAPSLMESTFGVTDEMRARMSAEDRTRARELVEGMLPVSRRYAGLKNDGAVIEALQRYPLETIQAPALVISAADDKVAPLRWGEYTAQNIPGARFLPFADGGHMLLGRSAEVREAIAAFLSEYAPPAPEFPDIATVSR
jgi:pimeloyl-ACP methyl ester carboxylesterase